MTKAFSRITNNVTKDVLYFLRFDTEQPTEFIMFNYVFSSISLGYMGLVIEETFVEKIRYFLRKEPDFFEKICGSQPDKSLLEMGYKELDIKLMICHWKPDQRQWFLLTKMQKGTEWQISV